MSYDILIQEDPFLIVYGIVMLAVLIVLALAAVVATFYTLWDKPARSQQLSTYPQQNSAEALS